LDRRVPWVLKVNQGLPVPWGLRDLLVLLVRPGRKVTKAILGLRVQQDPRVMRVLPDQKGHRARKVLTVAQDRVDLRAREVRKDRQESHRWLPPVQKLRNPQKRARRKRQDRERQKRAARENPMPANPRRADLL
jgi:hypothetical protein